MLLGEITSIAFVDSHCKTSLLNTPRWCFCGDLTTEMQSAVKKPKMVTLEETFCFPICSLKKLLNKIQIDSSMLNFSEADVGKLQIQNVLGCMKKKKCPFFPYPLCLLQDAVLAKVSVKDVV